MTKLYMANVDYLFSHVGRHDHGYLAQPVRFAFDIPATTQCGTPAISGLF